ncbi:MAG TPA: hypothetical protein VM534_07920 [Thermoanaerobaculia bacterium]|nr:hypothetical protein [Thermoanaerobaculia bacterium]
MIRLLISGLLVAAILPDAIVEPLMRRTNSEVATREALAALDEDPQAALEAFETASRIRPEPATSFNLGTARLESGDLAGGARELERVLGDPRLGPVAHYNRGAAALEANELDFAIRELTEALRREPTHSAAKRNLEIALRRRSGQPPEPQPAENGEGDRDEGEGGSEPGDPENEMEGILRSVEQQEQEELSRMRQTRGEAQIVDW